MSQTVKVMVRCRPMNRKQQDLGCKCLVGVDSKNKQINLSKSDSAQQAKSFTFDYVFGSDSLQSLVYEQSAFSLVDSVLDGYNGTMFAYGQTGSGKTHTMMGKETIEEQGIIPRTFGQIITTTKNQQNKTHLIRCSFMEIYNEEVHDLLGKDIKAHMEVKQSPQKGVFVKGLTQIEVVTIQKMEQCMGLGSKNRAVRATNMNAESSRSHTIFTVYVDSGESDEHGNSRYKASKLNLVDLAGSQRSSKTGATGDGMKQATKINLSLSALGNVISALVDGNIHHIPYRDSKLTRLLQDSLGGNTKTIMIAAVSPASYNYDQTLSTLRYASRAKFIKNKPIINEDPKDALLREYMDEIKKLKGMLQGKQPISLGHYQAYGENKQNSTKLEQELRSKQTLLRQEQKEKKMMAEKLQQLQQVLEKGGAPNIHDKTEMERIKRLKEKLRQQKKKEEEYQQEKAKREEELLSIEKHYKSLNQQVDEMRTRFKEIKKKYVANLTELRDIRDEHEDQKEQLLDTIRQQQQQAKKYRAVLAVLMSNSDLELIINNSEWLQDKKEWVIPAFNYREKRVTLPKLNGRSKETVIQQEQERKEVVFKPDECSRYTKNERRTDDTFRMNNVVKGARENNLEQQLIQTKTSRASQFASISPIRNGIKDKIFPATVGREEEKRRKNDKLDPIDRAH